MNTEKNYQEQLRELYETYAGKELETVLGVTVRSIQNYLKKDNPTIPSREVISKIRESFANHKEGKELKNHLETNNPGQTDQDYRDKFYQLLDKNSKLEEKIQQVQANLNELPRNLTELTGLILQGQKDIAQKVGQEIVTRLDLIETRLSSISSSQKVAPGKKQAHKGKQGKHS